jgi:geranylgeranyl diphosphate synthase type I
VTEPPIAVPALRSVRDLVDPELERYLADRGAELAGMAPEATVLVDELLRLLHAGGKRIRPALCWWANRAAGGADGPAIVRACAALELLHTFAIVHDDVMDGSVERRGVESTPAWFAKAAPVGVDPDGYGTSVAILVGDLAAVLAERLLRACGAPADSLALALDRFDRMRMEMAAGQLLDVSGPGRPGAMRVAALKTGSYTADGPVAIGVALAGAGAAVEAPLRAYARLVGGAFQLRDDVLDGDAPPDAAGRIDELVGRAVAALDGAPLVEDGARALVDLATLLRTDGEA